MKAIKLRELSLFLCLLTAPLVLVHSNYSSYCCSDGDCGLVEKVTMISNGDRIITITTVKGQKRTSIFKKDHIITPSPDGKDHACILDNGEARCLLLGGSI